MSTDPNTSLVIMGVAGCGKSSLGAALAQQLGFELIEGDDHHSPANRQKMQQGTPLTDADRAGWLATLAGLLAQRQGRGVVLTCSALRRAYRDQLRAAAPGLRFVFLDITPEQARQRVAARSAHFFNTALVESQFATLESPVGEPGVLRVDAAESPAALLAAVTRWAGAPTTPEAALSAAPGRSQASSHRSPQGGGTLVIPPSPQSVHPFTRVAQTLMAACLAVMATAVFVNVVLRYGFNSGLAASEELSRLLFVWMVFIGAAASYPAGEHMAFTSLVGLLRKRPLAFKGVTLLIRLLVLLACVLLGRGAWQQVVVGLDSHSVVLKVPAALLPLPALLCAVAIGAMALWEIVRARPLDLGHSAEVE